MDPYHTIKCHLFPNCSRHLSLVLVLVVQEGYVGILYGKGCEGTMVDFRVRWRCYFEQLGFVALFSVSTLTEAFGNGDATSFVKCLRRSSGIFLPRHFLTPRTS